MKHSLLDSDLDGDGDISCLGSFSGDLFRVLLSGSFKLLIISFRSLVCSCCSFSSLVILFSRVLVFVDGGDGVLRFVLLMFSFSGGSNTYMGGCTQPKQLYLSAV